MLEINGIVQSTSVQASSSNTSPSFASVSARPAGTRPIKLPTVSTAAVAAVYVDELEKKRRANSVIVTKT